MLEFLQVLDLTKYVGLNLHVHGHRDHHVLHVHRDHRGHHVLHAHRVHRDHHVLHSHQNVLLHDENVLSFQAFLYPCQYEPLTYFYLHFQIFLAMTFQKVHQ